MISNFNLFPREKSIKNLILELLIRNYYKMNNCIDIFDTLVCKKNCTPRFGVFKKSSCFGLNLEFI